MSGKSGKQVQFNLVGDDNNSRKSGAGVGMNAVTPGLGRGEDAKSNSNRQNESSYRSDSLQKERISFK